MNIKNNILFAVAVLSSMTFAFGAQDIKPKAFSEGDNVCFIGDSITHGGRYVRDIISFYATRFPENKINFFNVGISGDTVQHVNKRMENDILIHKPDVSTLMIGMNNVNRFAKPQMPDDYAKLVAENRAMYRENLESIMKKLKAANCKQIAFTPSIYDETSTCEAKPVIGKNAELGLFGNYVRLYAKKHGAKVVDMWGYMLDVNKEIQKTSPKDSVAGHDRVHPQDMGAYVMMANFVKTLQEPKVVSRVEINAAAQKVVKDFNCDVSAAKFFDNGLSFTLREYALPFAINKQEVQAEEIVGFLKEYNSQIVKIDGLKKGDYKMSIDGIAVGTYSAEELQKGVNLASNENTPQYKQTLEVRKAADEFRAVCGTLREINATEMWQNLEELKTFEEKIAKIDSLLKANKIKHPYIKNCAQNYKKIKPQQEQLFKKSRVLLDKIYETARPKPHAYLIEKI